MTKEDFLKIVAEVPKCENKTVINSYTSINIEDLTEAVERFNKVPSYEELLKENTNLKQALTDIIEYIKMHEILAKELLFTRSIPKDVKEYILQVAIKVINNENREI